MSCGPEPEGARGRLPSMHVNHGPDRPGAIVLSIVAVAALILAGCSAAVGGAPGSSGSGTSGQPPASGDPNLPVGTSVPPGSGLSGTDPGPGRVVLPQPGQLDVHAVPARTLSAATFGRRVVVTVDYTSGVEPCSVLDSIDIKRGTGSFAITLREGHGPGKVACIEIAEYKRALVDLGALDPGTYTITDGTGVAPAITVTVA